jgi:hypothetical protein
LLALVVLDLHTLLEVGEDHLNLKQQRLMHHLNTLEHHLNTLPTVVEEDVHTMVTHLTQILDMEHLVVVHHRMDKLLRVVD